MDANQLTIDRYVVDTLMRDLIGHDRSPSAFIVYLTLTAQARRGRVAISHAQIAELAGISKRAVQSGIARLAGRGFIRIHKRAATAVPDYEVLTPWRRGEGSTRG